jgi:hypothetical protein
MDQWQALVNTLMNLRVPQKMENFLDSKSKSKGVPLHAMEALGGRGGIAPTHT